MSGIKLLEVKYSKGFTTSQRAEILRRIREYPSAPKPKGRRGSASDSKVIYRNVICSFDIETTQLHNIKQSFMYVWQFAISTDFVIVGHSWTVFKSLIDLIKSELKPKERILVFVHNLSYEFIWLSGIYHFNTEDVFCMDSRKIAKALLDDKIEFRCSYILTNLSLDNFTKRMQVKHTKLSGDKFDYTKTRYPWTYLKKYELNYCINDVLGLNEALLKYMESEGDSLYTLPMTATGFVRREIKKKVRTLCHSYMVGIQPPIEVMEVLREAFRGGNTHANRFYVDSILKDVSSADESSAYPFALMAEYPSSKWRYIGLCSLETVKTKIEHHYALVMRVVIKKLRLKNQFWGFPYIPLAKCRKDGKALRASECTVDNGRVIEAEYLEISLTDLDLRIILDEYNCEICFYQVWMSRYKPLPPIIRAAINQYYKDKTELKDVEGQEVFYQRQKARLNSIYGLMVQNPLKHSILFDEGEYKPDQSKTDEELLEKYSKKGFLPYQWGVFCTAISRFNLETGLKIAYSQGAIPVYCDTDSIKYLGKVDFTEYNKGCIEHSIKSGSFATDPQGITHYMGVFEDEGVADYFITQGAKKYATCTKGKLKLTCAGVSKKKGADELMSRAPEDDKTKGLSLFRDDFIFKESAGIEAIYNDKVSKYITVKGHRLHIIQNVYFHDSTYTVGKTGEYKILLQKCRELLKNEIQDNTI